ncbi:MAG: PadR family transcriptional regulator [Propionicimonas sp.]|nr:PadR family transcriptional regulator [Propionicimonas sp.]
MNYPPHEEWDSDRPGKGGHHHHHPHGHHGFGPGPGFGFGFGPGFGGPGFGPGPGRRGGRNRRGQVRESILALLVEQPLNGYQIMQSLDERTQGLWRPSPGAVYPALNQLEDEGLIESFDNDGQKAFRLTETGRQAAGQVDAPWEAVNARFGGRSPESMKALWQELGSLAGATKELVRSASPEQVDQATAIIAEARRRIYGLLAAEPGTANPDDLR